MDELIQSGILMRPEEIGVTAEFISPCLIIPKLEKDSFRLVSDLTGLNRFVKRSPMSSPTIQEAKTDLARKKYFAEIDLSNYFFQGGLRREDCSFLAVQHPFKGIFCYTASPQGLKNSSEHSYERLGRVYGDMMQQSRIAHVQRGSSREFYVTNHRKDNRRGSRHTKIDQKPLSLIISRLCSMMLAFLLPLHTDS